MTNSGNVCQFHITIPAKKLGLLKNKCIRPPARSIAGFDDGYPIAADFCEVHYQIMSDWLDKWDKKKEK